MKAAEFYSDTPRIMGTEMEHNNTVIAGEFNSALPNPLQPIVPFIAEEIGVPYLADKDTRGQLMHPYSGVGSSGFLPTGDRLYVDLGHHAEFCTAESSSAAEVVGREFTGGDLLFTAMSRALQTGAIREYKIYKNAAGNGDYWGYHENYLTLRRVDIVRAYAPPLVTHLVTRQIFAGAGDVTARGEFLISQKMPSVRNELVGSASGGSGGRPILDVGRDEPHANGHDWRRIHVASGDPHLNPRAAWLQLITTSIVARLPEAGVNTDDLRINNSVDEAQLVTRDISLTHQLEVGGENAKKMTALQIQKELHACAIALNDRSPLPAEEQLGLEIWGSVLDSLGAGDDTALDWVEWLDKRQLLAGSATRNGVKWSDPVIQAINREWASLNPAKGFGLRRAFRNPVPIDVMTGLGDLTPPNGRPQLRAAVILDVIALRREVGVNNVTASLNWGSAAVRFNGIDQPKVLHDWYDPYGLEQRVA